MPCPKKPGGRGGLYGQEQDLSARLPGGPAAPLSLYPKKSIQPVHGRSLVPALVDCVENEIWEEVVRATVGDVVGVVDAVEGMVSVALVEELAELEGLVESEAIAELAELADTDGITVGEVQTEAWLEVIAVL